MREVKLERLRVLLGDYGIEKAGEGEMNSVLLHTGHNMYPDEVKVPKSPDDWVDPATNTSKGDPTFEKVENPGRWSSFSYRPVFDSGAQRLQYNSRCLPYGCHPVPPN